MSTDPGSPPTVTDVATEHLVTALRRDPQHALLATDFDGVLAPIVDDPDTAAADPAALAALGRLGAVLGQVAVITGRPAPTAVRLGGLDRAPGLERLVVLGQYGVERWDAATGEYHLPEVPPALAEVRALLPEVLAAAGWPDARIEDKGRAVAVHTRRLADPDRALDELAPAIADLAAAHGLRVEPGRRVLEVRATGVDKGQALRSLVTELGARTCIYAGDDLGDLPAFEEMQTLRTEGLTTCAVWAASAERTGLARMADVVAEGPSGVAQWLTTLADRIEDPNR